MAGDLVTGDNGPPVECTGMIPMAHSKKMGLKFDVNDNIEVVDFFNPLYM